MVSAAGANGDGLSTIVLPVASAGANFIIARTIGMFHGTIAAATPRGTRSMMMKLCSSSNSTGRLKSSMRLAVCCRTPVPRAKSVCASHMTPPCSRTSSGASSSALAGQDVGGGEQLLRPLLRRNAPPDGKAAWACWTARSTSSAGADRDLGDDVVEATGID